MFYIDKDYKCHATNPDGEYRAIDLPLFDNYCQTFVEGYLYIPPGESFKLDGVVYRGEMYAPWKPYYELDSAQREYERQKLADAENALAILLGGGSV